MKKGTFTQAGMASMLGLCLLLLAAKCTKEYSLDISVQPANSGTVNVSPGGGEYEEGTEVSLSPVPSSGYRFDSWSGSDASSVNNDRIVMSKDMMLTANFVLQHMIRLKTGTGLNPGGEILFVALSENVNYFDLTSDQKFNYDKTQADWYIDGGIIPFTTDYKEFDLDPGNFYIMLRAVGMVMVTTIDVIAGKQTFEISADGYSISVDVIENTKSTGSLEEQPRKVIITR